MSTNMICTMMPSKNSEKIAITMMPTSSNSACVIGYYNYFFKSKHIFVESRLRQYTIEWRVFEGIGVLYARLVEHARD